jgi:hypothetical protein
MNLRQITLPLALPLPQFVYKFGQGGPIRMLVGVLQTNSPTLENDFAP